MSSFPIPQGSKAWKSKMVSNLLGGINSSAAPDQLNDNQAVTLRNVKCYVDRVYSDSGYVTLGQAVRGGPQGVFEFPRRSGLSDDILVTTDTVYIWIQTLDQWQYLQGTAGTTLTAQSLAGSTSVSITSATGFSINDFIGIALDDSSQLQTTITNIVGTTITIADPIPTGRTANIGAAFIRAVVLTGNLDTPVIDTVVSGSDWWVFTNGSDVVKRYDGTDVVDVPNLPSAGQVVCNAVTVFNSALFLLGTVEGGINYLQRIRRSDQTDPTNWTTGTAGYDDLLDDSDVIRYADILGTYLIIYRDRSIARGQFIGSGGINYYWETTITGEGLLAGASVVSLGDEHVFVGHANVYTYAGDFGLTTIGDYIYYNTFGISGDLDPSYSARVQCTYIEELDEVWVFYPTISSSDHGCDKVLRYNVGDKFWYDRQFADHIAGFGFYTHQVSVIWGTAAGTWQDYTRAWNSKQSTSNSPITLLCPTTSQYIMSYDYSSNLDNTIPIGYTVETKDFTEPEASLRFDELVLYMQGTGVLIEYSTDAGLTYETLATVSVSNMTRVIIGRQFVCNRVRFRISGTNADFILEWFKFNYKIESVSNFTDVHY